jgi:hypothetical protein
MVRLSALFRTRLNDLYYSKTEDTKQQKVIKFYNINHYNQSI